MSVPLGTAPSSRRSRLSRSAWASGYSAFVFCESCCSNSVLDWKTGWTSFVYFRPRCCSTSGLISSTCWRTSPSIEWLAGPCFPSTSDTQAGSRFGSPAEPISRWSRSLSPWLPWSPGVPSCGGLVSPGGVRLLAAGWRRRARVRRWRAAVRRRSAAGRDAVGGRAGIGSRVGTRARRAVRPARVRPVPDQHDQTERGEEQHQRPGRRAATAGAAADRRAGRGSGRQAAGTAGVTASAGRLLRRAGNRRAPRLKTP